MLALRLSDGFSLSEYRELFSEDFADGKQDIISAYLKNGYLKIDSDRLKLTPKGFYVSNAIMAELL